MSHEWTSNTGNKFRQEAPPDWRVCPTCNLNVEASVSKCPHDGSVLVDLVRAERLFEGRYEVSSIIASGGMGTVYKAVQRSLGKTVAIKMLKTQDTSTAMWSRFKQEATLASRLSHPNIISIYEFGETTEGQPFMVMEFIEGTDLGAVLKSQTKLRVFEAVKVFIQVADAMQHAHSKGVLHRDLKPSNVMLTNLSGVPEIKIVDFGIAKVLKGSGDTQGLTQTGEIFGSPYYMSPEQTVGKSVDHRSDIYSVGCIMYETLAGTVPISGETAFETLMKHVSEKPIPIQERKLKENISDALQKVVMKCLEKEPAKRFQAMAELQMALSSVPEAQGKSPGVLSLSGTSIGITSKTKKIILASVGIICLIAGAVTVRSTLKIGASNSSVDSSPIKQSAETASLTQSEPDYLTAAPSSDTLEPSGSTNRPVLQDQVVWQNINDRQVVEKIQANPKLSNICLLDCDITDESAAPLAKLKLLRLEILQCPRLTGKGYSAIIGAQRYLQWLKIAHPSNSGNIVASINRLAELKSLALNDVPRLDSAALRNLPVSLVELSLAANQGIPTEDFASLARLSNLEKLDLSYTLASNNSVCKLTKLKKLKSLQLNLCPVTDDAIGCIIQLRNLQRLGLYKTFIGREGFFKLKALPELLEVNVGDTLVRQGDAEKFNDSMTLHLCNVIPYTTHSVIFQRGSLTRDLNLPGKEKF